jgi:ankyrin repeat protein
MNGDTAFHVALTYANLGAMKLLLESGGEVLDNGHQGLTVVASAGVHPVCWGQTAQTEE